MFFFYFPYFFYVKAGIYLPVLLTFTLLTLPGNVKFFKSFLAFKLFLLILLWLLFAIFNYPFSSAKMYGLEKLFIFFPWCFIFFLSIPNIVLNLNLYLKLYILFSIVLCVLLMIEYGNPISYFFETLNDSSRLGSVVVDEISLNPIWVSRYLGASLLVVIFYFFNTHNSKVFSIGMIPIILVMLIYIFASGSKAVILILSIIGLIDVFAFQSIKRKVYYLVLFVIFVFIAFNLDFLNFSFVKNRFLTENDISVGQRIDFQSKIINAFDLKTFLIGSGIGSVGYVISNFDARFYPHNLFLEILFEFGFFVFFILSFLSIKILVSFRLFLLSSHFTRIVFYLFLFFFLNTFFSGDLASNIDFFLFLFISFMVKDYQRSNFD
jgi:hypothetical protein